jgi:predicted membrane protein
MEMTDQMTDTNTDLEAKPDIYHNQDRLMRLADLTSRISWLFLVLFVVIGLIIAYLVWYFYSNHMSIEQFFLNLPTFLVPFFLGGFFWIALKVISEAIYLLMDIEDNTRRPKSPSNE